MAAGADEGAWRFGRYELHAEHGVLMRGGRRVPLTATDFAILIELVRAGGDVVSKDDLIRTVWGSHPIGDGNLATYIARLRKKLDQAVIQTAHGEGYRLAVHVERPGSAEELRAAYLGTLLQEAEDARQRMRDEDWDAVYVPRLDDVRSALDWAFARPERKRFAIALAGAAARLFQRASAVPLGRAYCERAMALLDEDARPADAAWLLHQAGMLIRGSDRSRALDLFRQAETLYRRQRDPRRLGGLKALLGGTYLYLGRHEEARQALGEAEKLLTTTVQTKALCNVQNEIGSLYAATGAFSEATRYYGFALDLARMLNDPVSEGAILVNLGEVEFAQGAIDRAICRAEEAARHLRHGPSIYPACAIVNLATYYAISGDFVQARKHGAHALDLLSNEGGYWLRNVLQVWAALAAESGRFADAARLLGFVNEQFRRSGEARQLPERRLREIVSSRLDQGLSKESLSVWLQEGARWGEPDAIKQVKSTLLVEG